MTTIFEPPSFNSARKVTQIFQKRPASNSRPTLYDQFVPYQRERDHLGRLLTANSKPFTGRTPSLKCFSRNFVPNQDPTGNTVDRIFRQTRIHSQGEKTNVKKCKIRSNSTKQLPAPAVGHYDAVAIADKIKFPKPRGIVFSSKQRPNSSKRVSTETAEKKRVVHYHQIPTEHVAERELSKAPLNLNLPELEKYLQMKKLKVPLNQNFEQSHLKFKELAQRGLGLARNIRKNIQYV